jgi:hypothetical protein
MVANISVSSKATLFSAEKVEDHPDESGLPEELKQSTKLV